MVSTMFLLVQDEGTVDHPQKAYPSEEYETKRKCSFGSETRQSHPNPLGFQPLACCLDVANNPKKVTESMGNIEDNLSSLLDENQCWRI